MTRARGVAIPALLGFALVLLLPFAPTPALAQSSTLSIQIDTPASGAVIDGSPTVMITGQASSGLASIDRIELKLVRDLDGATVVSTAICCDGPRNGAVPFSYTTPALGANGPYRASVHVTGYILLGGLPATPADASRSFGVALPAAPPTGVTAQLADGKVSVTWRAAPAYPDLMGYVIFRKIGAAAPQGISGAGRDTTTYTDTQPPRAGGTVQYFVASLRQGAEISDNPNNWLRSPLSDPATVNVPVPVTTTLPGQPTGPTTTLPPGGGLQPDGAVNGVDISGFFSSTPTPSVTFPPAAPPPTFPDTGYSEILPFPSTSLGSTSPSSKLTGRQQGQPGSASGSGTVDAGNNLDSSNRRALLVPVAAGSVLCVAALHLRWLNRRLLIAPAGKAAAGGAGAGGSGPGAGRSGPGATTELEAEPFLPDREPVGASAGTGAGTPRPDRLG